MSFPCRVAVSTPSAVSTLGLVVAVLVTVACGTPVAAQQCRPAAGGATCEMAGGIASLADPDGSDLTVGNPIHPVTGNKYQAELDAPPLPGPFGLELLRHYNASYGAGDSPWGRGWALSYDTRLYRTGDRIQIVQADGRRLVFRLPGSAPADDAPAACEAEAPGQGRLFRRPDGYRWIWPWGRMLDFDADGWLVRIGPVDGSDAESVRIARDAAGRIVQVTDPAGRRMMLEYSEDGHLAAVVHPLGTWRHRIDAAGRLRSVQAPDGSMRRYEYDDIGHPSHLTAITAAAAGQAGAAAREIGRWSYDAEGRVAAYRRPDGSELRMTYLQPDAAEQPRAEAAPRTVVSVLTNALGERTRYTAVEIAGRWRVTEIRGPGCAECGPTDVRMRHDARGQLTARWHVDGDGVEYRRDALGRVVQVLAVRGFDRPPRSTRLLRRYEYADDESGWPSVIARPSVVPGREHRITVIRDGRGSPQEVIREGFAPPPDAGQQATPIPGGGPGLSRASRRTVRFRHEAVGGRRLLVALDGPLDNGPAASPADSDIVRFGHDAAGMLTHVSLPGGIERRYLERDAAGRPLLVATSDGHRLVHRRIVRDVAGRATALEVTAWRLDAQGRAVAATRLQRRAAWRYDAAGRIEEAVDPAGRAIRYDHDAAGRPTGVRDASGHRAVVERDAEGRVRVSALYRPGEATPLRAAYFIRGGSGGIRAVLLPDGRLLRFQRDRNGRTVGLVAAAGELRLAHPRLQQAALTAESRDDFGQVVQRIRRHHGPSAFRFDDAGRLVERIDAGLERRLYRHDAAGRLLAEETLAPDGMGGWQIVESVRRHYQGSLLVRVEGPVQQTVYRRDALGRIEETEVRLAGLPGRVLRTATRRDAISGLVSAELLADGRSLVVDRTNTQDGALPRRLRLRSAFVTAVSGRLARWLPARLHRAVDRRLPAMTLVDGIVVDAFDGLVAYRHGNGIRVERAHDPVGRLVGLRTGTAASDIAHWRFEYGAGRRIRGMEAVGHGGTRGMPVAESAAGAVDEVDAGGRVVAADGRRYEYGPGGRLAAVRDGRDGELIARYAYNERGQRVSKSVRARDDRQWKTTFFLWSRDRLGAELDEDGAVAKQHVALDDGGRSLPVALLGRDGSVFAVHVEHRGAPIAMTDAGRQIVWRAEVAPSGRATVVQALGGLALDLRLPGQHADDETGLHDNWHRTYDPRRGRYLQPDPLGYPDGDDPYAFAGGDPLNRSDPFGLYEIDVHYYMTFFLGVTAGLHPEDARIVALASQYVDDNPLTRPLAGTDLVSAVGSALRNQQQLLGYHFVLSGADGRTLAAWRNDRLDGPDSPQLRNLFAAVEGEGVGHDGGLQFLGEYLHALADTYAHRDADDMPYDALLATCGIGHGFALHEPDFTYDGVGGPGPHGEDGDPPGDRFWQREARTLAMELRVHDVLRDYGDPARARSFAEIEAALREFNAIPERERGRGGADFPRKLARLEAALAALGYGALDLDSEAAYGYSEREAALNRRVFLRDERTGAPLLEIDFPGTCLEGGTRCRTR